MDVHQIEALALVVLDGISILVPAAKIPVEILHKILDGLDGSDAIPFSFSASGSGLSDEQVSRVRAQLAGMASARASAVTSAMAKKLELSTQAEKSANSNSDVLPPFIGDAETG